MTQKIQIKRGNTKDLPKLNLGEPAFSLDTKDLWIGNKNNNQKMQTRNNLIINGNFQVVSEKFDTITDKLIIAPGTSRYIYGNFYISNASNSLGNITISRPDSGFITIDAANAQMSLEYREKLAEYFVISSNVYSNIKTLLNQDMTLSFDYKNTAGSLSFLSGNAAGMLNNITIPNGNGNASNSFSMKYMTIGNVNEVRIVLLSTTQIGTYTITIGNIKLEQGTEKTPFFPNPMYADILAIEQVYKVYDTASRCLNGNIGDTFIVYCPISFPNCFKNSSIKITVNTIEVYSLDGIKQTGFTISSSHRIDYNCILFQAKKTNNLLKEIYIIANFSVDLRPY